MQLNDFISIWQQTAEPNRETQQMLDEVQLAQILKVKASDRLAKIAKSFLSEIGVYLILGLFFSGICIWKSDDQLIISFFIVVMTSMLAAGMFMWRKYKQIAHLGATSDNLLASLQQAKAFLKKFIKQYVYINTINGILFFSFGIIIGLTSGSGKLLEEVLRNPKVWWILIPVSIAGWVGLYFISRKTVNYTYGRHLRNLEKSLEELNEAN